ncbi:uncharacterized protein LOC130452957 isoform X1 [Diorhabda sublineata]|uniref:uncharacterized protein LOC130452957 isoform X1 n=1 Tax=Diorhabda sublineata TaxID=1163346 RepID=UPI0024E08B9D|nr:uncharacterized protein LOC130452957 isoform X1 [Diorhabda sublineata]
MDLERKKKICEYCGKEFSNTSARNKHMLKFHCESSSSQSLLDKKSQGHKHRICPICIKEERFTNYDSLNKHLTNTHKIIIKQSLFNFRNLEEFETWRSQGNREVDYACQRKNKLSNGNESIYYICNRSNYKGYNSTAHKRKTKVTGSIHIYGECPSRFIVKVDANGSVKVTFIETHVGHNDELIRKRLTKIEEETLVAKLKSGITIKKIIRDARKIGNQKLTRVNLITKVDLVNLIRKHNIEKKLHDEDEYTIQDCDNNSSSITEEQEREIQIEELIRKLRSLQGKDFDRFMEYIENFKRGSPTIPNIVKNEKVNISE